MPTWLNEDEEGGYEVPSGKLKPNFCESGKPKFQQKRTKTT